MKVLITTSGTGSRLGEISKHFNKALIKIGDKAVISHIIDLYLKKNPKQEFVITVGYKSQQVIDYIILAHSKIKKQIKFVYVDTYEGPKSSVLYSISKAESRLQEPFIFHACDTFLIEKDGFSNYDISNLPKENVLWVSKARKNDLYRKIKVNKKSIKIHDKSYMDDFAFDYIGVAYVHKYEQFWSKTKALLKNTGNQYSDIDVIENNAIVSKIDFDTWYDIGNVIDLQRAKSDFKSEFDILSKVDEDIYFIDDLVIKYFSSKAKCEARQQRIIPNTILSQLTPELLFTKNNFYVYKKIVGNTLNKTTNSYRILEFLNFCKEQLWLITPEQFSYRDEAYYFYIDKTLRRVETFLNGNFDTSCTINTIHVPDIYTLLETICKFQFLFNTKPSGYHGDLVLSNVIDTGFDFVLIDWREYFDLNNIHIGDFHYDIAKLVHSHIMDHSMLNDHLFLFKEEIENDKFIYEIDIPQSSRMKESLNSIENWCLSNQINWKKILLIVGLIWVNMAPLHDEKIGKFLFIYGKYFIHQTVFMK